MARKETTKRQAEEKASSVKQKDACEKLMLEECYALLDGKQHSVQQLLAYAAQARKLGGGK